MSHVQALYVPDFLYTSQKGSSSPLNSVDVHELASCIQSRSEGFILPTQRNQFAARFIHYVNMFKWSFGLSDSIQGGDWQTDASAG